MTQSICILVKPSSLAKSIQQMSQASSDYPRLCSHFSELIQLSGCLGDELCLVNKEVNWSGSTKLTILFWLGKRT